MAGARSEAFHSRAAHRPTPVPRAALDEHASDVPYAGAGNAANLSRSPEPGPVPADHCELGRGDGGERCYVWFNLDIDMVSIGTVRFDFEALKPFAPLIRRLKCERGNSSEWFYYVEVHALRDNVNLREMYVVCAGGFDAWHGASLEHYWPCGPENVFCIHLDDGRTMRSTELDEVWDQMLEERLRQEEEVIEALESWAAYGHDYL